MARVKQILKWLVLGTIAGCVVAAEAKSGDECLICHSALGDKPSGLFTGDIHHEKGISCAGCHGGDATSSDMEHAMDRKAGFLGRPSGDSISVMCARCHSDAEQMTALHASIPTGQLESLQQSVHGKLSTKGGARIAQCTTCHGSHGILAVKNPRSPVNARNIVVTCARCHSDAAYIRSYNPSLPVDQRDKYRTSVHGTRNAAGDTKVADCASCHGNHGILSAKDVKSSVYPTNLPQTCAKCHGNPEYMKGYGIPTDQYEKFAKSVHGVALLERNDLGAPACNGCHGNHGATPPGVESISKVCGTCHALNSELFSSSPHKKAFDDLNVPECESCHGNHGIVAATNAMVGTSSDAVCSRCHGEGSKGYDEAGTMRRLIDSLDAREAVAKALVEEAEQKGMEVGEAKFRLRDVRQSRLEARTTIHAVNEEKLRTVVEKGLGVAAWASGEGQHAIDDYYFRRIGLGVSTLIITILVIALYLFIRRLERQQRQGRTTTYHQSTSSTS
jgi:predicted CXXCH cytochrome family protein